MQMPANMCGGCPIMQPDGGVIPGHCDATGACTTTACCTMTPDGGTVCPG
jgi:hypothetical protein